MSSMISQKESTYTVRIDPYRSTKHNYNQMKQKILKENWFKRPLVWLCWSEGFGSIFERADQFHSDLDQRHALERHSPFY